MLTLVIDTKDKNLKKLSLFKRKPWQKPQEHDYQIAEKLLDKLYTEMEEKGIQKGSITCTIFFNNNEIECDPFELDTKGTIFTLQDLINQEFAKSSNEDTPKHIETLQRQINEEIGQYSKEEPIHSTHKRIENSEIREMKPKSLDIPPEASNKNKIVSAASVNGKINIPEVVIEQDTDTQDIPERNEPEIELELELESTDEKDQVKVNRDTRLIADFKEYIHIQPKEKVIKETLETCDTAFIYDYFGVDKEEYTKENIEFYKQHAIKTNLKSKTIVDPIKTYQSLIEEETTKHSNQLAEKYKEEMAYKPEDYANENFEEIYAPVRDRYNEEYNEFEKSQQTLLNDKKDVIEKEKQAEIDSVIKEIELKYQKLFTEEEAKTTEAIHRHKESLSLNNKADKETIFQTLITERLNQREQSLLEYKSKQEQELLETIETASFNLVGLQQELIDSIEREIEKESPSWLQTIAKEKEQRLHEVKQQKELELKETELAIQQRKQSNDFEIEKEKIDLAKQKQLNEFEIKQKSLEKETSQRTTEETAKTFFYPAAQPNTTDTQIVLLEQKIEKLLDEKNQQRTVPNLSITNITTICLLLFSLTGFGYLAYANNQTKAELSRAVEQNSQTNVEEQSTAKVVEEPSQDLETLLKERNFALIYEAYNDKASLTAIETYLLETEDLPQLKEFNKRFASATGKLNEAILSDNDDTIINEYQQIKNKQELTDSQKKRVKLAYYNKDKVEEAKKVGE